jgi:hypothetical protein
LPFFITRLLCFEKFKITFNCITNYKWKMKNLHQPFFERNLKLSVWINVIITRLV